MLVRMVKTLGKTISRFGGDRRGATAVEFALVAPVFLYLLIGIVEASLLFFTTTVVDGAVMEAARTIRTGQAQNSGDSLTTFKTALCGILTTYNCNDMTIDVRTYPSFSSVSIPVLHYNDDGELVDEDGNVYVAEYTPGGSGDITVVRVMYSWSFVTPFIGALFGDTGSGKFLSTTAVFKNEPYE